MPVNAKIESLLSEAHNDQPHTECLIGQKKRECNAYISSPILHSS